MCRHSVPPSTKFRASRVRIASCAAVLLFGLMIPGSSLLLGQDTGAPADASGGPPRGHLGIHDLAVYAAYYSSASPNGSITSSAAAKLPSDFTGGGRIGFDWTKYTERSTLSLSYTPSYTARVRYSSLNSLNHALSLTTTRKFARWTAGFSAGADYSNVEQFLFSTNALGNLASVPSSFRDFATGILSGTSVNPALSNVLANAPLVESPLRVLLYGQRMFTAATQISLTYSYSPRLSVTVSGGGGRTQHMSDEQQPGAYLIQDTTFWGGSVGASYSLSPRNQVGGSVSTRCQVSLYDYCTSTTQANYGWTSRSWVFQFHGGVGFTSSLRQTLSQFSSIPKPVAGGSLGFRTSTQTFLVGFDRTAGDSFGAGSTTSHIISGTWRWARPGSRWWLESGGGWQQLKGGAFADSSGSNASLGIGRAFSAHVALFSQIAYLNYESNLQTSMASQSQTAVRISLLWSERLNTPR